MERSGATWAPGILVATDTDGNKKKHDSISPGGPKAESGGKGAGGPGAVLAPHDSVLTPVSGYKEVWRKRIGSTQRPFSEPPGTFFSLEEVGLIDMM